MGILIRAVLILCMPIEQTDVCFKFMFLIFASYAILLVK